MTGKVCHASAGHKWESHLSVLDY